MNEKYFNPITNVKMVEEFQHDIVLRGASPNNTVDRNVLMILKSQKEENLIFLYSVKVIF